MHMLGQEEFNRVVKSVQLRKMRFHKLGFDYAENGRVVIQVND